VGLVRVMDLRAERTRAEGSFRKCLEDILLYMLLAMI